MSSDDVQTDSTPERADMETAADRREQAADARDRDLDEREYRALAREDAESERADDLVVIKAAADQRDEQAEARDSEANKRYMAANLNDWLRSRDDDEPYEARDLALQDRISSRRDRIASADDRDRLTGKGTPPRPDVENG